MDMNFDMENRQEAPFSLTAEAPGAGPLDWHGLRARLVAGYALNAALKPEKPSAIAIGEGSFDRGSAEVISVYGRGVGTTPAEEQGGVNPSGLANGNSGYDTEATVAGNVSAGD